MAFDPDKYLAENSTPAGGGFDPDAYLAQVAEVDDSEASPAKGRFEVKNFGNNAQVNAEYIKRINPGAQTRVVDGEIQVLMPGEAKWKWLDKPGLEWADVSDVMTDAATGTLQGLATTGGAIAGALAGPAGAYAGGAGASALSGAGLEALRQKLGEKLGINKDVNGTDVAIAGGTGLISPLLFGQGKYLKGALPAAWSGFKNTVAPKIGQLASGIDSGVIKSYAENMDKVDALDQTGVTGFTENLRKQLTNWLGETKTARGKAVQAAVDSTTDTVDVSGAKAAFQNRIAQLRMKPDLTPADKAEISALESAYQKYFTRDAPVLNKSVDELAEEVDLFNRLNRIQSGPQAPTVNPRMVTGITEAPRNPYDVFDAKETPQLEQAINQAKQRVNEFSDAAVDANELAAQALKQQKDQETASILKRLSEINTPKDYNMPNGLPADRAFDLQQRLKQLAKFEQNMTPETASMKGSARGAYGAINEAFDRANPAIRTAKEGYQDILRIDDVMGNNFDTTQKTYGTLLGLNARNKKVLSEQMNSIARGGGPDIADDVKILQAYDVFGNPSLNPLSAGGTTSTSRTIPLAIAGRDVGALIGNKVADGSYAGTKIGATIGNIMSNLGASPSGMKRIMKANRALNMSPVGTFFSSPAVAPAASELSYEMLKRSDEE